MTQCQRCGAVNEATSRFCVACGAPLVERTSERASPLAPTVHSQGQTAPAPPPGIGSRPPERAVIGSGNVPPSANLPFAETASPEEPGDGPHWTEPWKAPAPANPAPFQGAAPPVSAHLPGAAPSTGAMPGVSQDPELLPDDVPRILAGFLVSYDNEPLGRFWPIYQGRNRIGRKGAGFELDVELEHPTASSRHAVLLASATPGRMKLEDTGSTNGTLVNGVRLAPGARVELADGAQVRFGLLSTLVKIV